MEEFKESELIVAQGKEIMQLEKLEQLTDIIFGEEYKELSESEKLNQRYKKALYYAMIKNMPMVHSKKGIIKSHGKIDTNTKYELSKSFVIDDEITFILSLCQAGYLKILEREDANIFLTNEEKAVMKDMDGNYIYVNALTNKIMKRHIQKFKEVEEHEM